MDHTKTTGIMHTLRGSWFFYRGHVYHDGDWTDEPLGGAVLGMCFWEAVA